MEQVRSAYIHIPFCESMCHYCSFVKYVYNENNATAYIDGLTKEIDTYLPEKNYQLKTIYIGGGTPTSLNIGQLERLLTKINEKVDRTYLEEFTIEVNPGELDAEKARLLKDYDVNRISFGVQVMDDAMLKQIGRAHRVKDVYRTVDLLTENKFNNISLDLIYALPHQTVQGFTRSLDDVLSFGLPHYSTYALQIEPKTFFHYQHKKGKLHRPKENDEIAMYEILREKMEQNGVEQYEISNFAKRGFESKHNLVYWNNEYYYGFGAGASGYLPGVRIANLRPLASYTKQAQLTGKPILERDEITIKEQIEEELFLGLRKIKGYNLTVFEQKYNFSLFELYENQIRLLVEQGLLVIQNNLLKLTEQGMLLANRVVEEFILDDSQVTFLKSKQLD